MPALLKRTSICSEGIEGSLERAVDRRAVGGVDVNGQRVRQGRGDGLGSAAVEVRDDDPGALAREPLRGGAPEARGAAGHERDLSFEPAADRRERGGRGSN